MEGVIQVSDKEKDLQKQSNLNEEEEFIELEEDTVTEEDEDNDIPYVSYRDEKKGLFDGDLSSFEMEDNTEVDKEKEEEKSSLEDILFVDYGQKPTDLEDTEKEVKEFELDLNGTSIGDFSFETLSKEEGITEEENVFVPYEESEEREEPIEIKPLDEKEETPVSPAEEKVEEEPKEEVSEPITEDTVEENTEETSDTEDGFITRVAKNTKKKGFFASLFSKKKKQQEEPTEEIATEEVKPEEDTNEENTNDSALVDENTLSLDSSEEVTIPSETTEEETPSLEDKPEEEFTFLSLDKSEEEKGEENEVVSPELLEDATLEVEQLNTEGENSEEPVIEDTEAGGTVEDSNPPTEEGEKPKKKGIKSPFTSMSKRTIFWGAFGLVTAAILATLFLLPSGDGEGLFGSLLGGDSSETVVEPVVDQGQPVPPITNETFEEQPQVDPNNPNGLPEDQQDVVDQEMMALSQNLKPLFDSFGAYVDEVVKTEGKIVIKGTIKHEDLFEINRLVRMAQVESYPYLVGSLNKTEVHLHKGKTTYAYETSKTVVEFLSKLNYEDRHSSQLWWRKSSTLKNGRNLKATLVKDRLYVDYLHPIYPEEVKTPAAEGEAGEGTEGDSTKPAEGGEEGGLTPDKYDQYNTFENDKYGLFFDYPKSIEVKETTVTEDGFEALMVSNKDGKDLPFGFNVVAGAASSKGVDTNKSGEEAASKMLFLYLTNEIEKENPEFEVIEKEKELTNFSGQKVLTRKYKVNTQVQDYHLTFGTVLINNSFYMFSISHEKEDSLDAELMLKSSNLGDIKEASDKDTSTDDKATASINDSCKIKGDKDTKTYFLENHKDYAKTTADLVFCTEESATKAGFQKAS